MRFGEPAGVLVEAGRVVASGDAESLAAQTVSKTETLPGALVVPGLHDAHIHAASLARVRTEVDVPDATPTVGGGIACSATARTASSVNSRLTCSSSNSRWYCFTSAFFGSVRIFFSEASSRSSSVATTGRRPTNSGIRPYLSRSSGST